MSTKANIRYGDVDVTDDDLSPSAVRRRISIMIPEDVLARLRQLAAVEGIGYQTLMNRILREYVLGDQSITSRLDRLERAVMSAGRPLVHGARDSGRRKR